MSHFAVGACLATHIQISSMARQRTTMTDLTRPLHIFAVNLEFPPLGGPGVWRILAMVKYAAQAGHQVTVLCSDRSSWHNRRDESLLKQLPAGVEVVRIQGWLLTDALRLARWAGQQGAVEAASANAFGFPLATRLLLARPRALLGAQDRRCVRICEPVATGPTVYLLRDLIILPTWRDMSSANGSTWLG